MLTTQQISFLTREIHSHYGKHGQRYGISKEAVGKREFWAAREVGITTGTRKETESPFPHISSGTRETPSRHLFLRQPQPDHSNRAARSCITVQIPEECDQHGPVPVEDQYTTVERNRWSRLTRLCL